MDLTITLLDVINKNITVPRDIFIQSKLSVATKIIKSTFNEIFKDGASFANLLYKTPLCWLDISWSYFTPKYAEKFLWGGLSINYSTA